MSVMGSRTIVALGFLLAATMARSQEAPSVTGTVIDPSKNPLPATQVSVRGTRLAQLIIAEAAVGSATSVTAINNARAADGLPPYSGPTDAPTVMAQVIEERRRELFLEATRLYDLHRLSLPLNPAPGTPYSTAASKGGKYGSQTCFPLPDVREIQ